LGQVEARTLVELLGSRAADQPNRLGYAFLEKGEREAARLDYATLDRKARAVAAVVRAAVNRSERAILLYPSGLDFVAAFFGCLYANVVAVPVFPPDPRGPARTLPRVRAVAKDSSAKLILTTSTLLAHKETFLKVAPELGELTWLATDSVDDDGTGFVDEAVDASTIAFLQYTSGSTAAPRGVVVTHQNLLHNASIVKRAFVQSEESTLVTWLPMYHDMGLIGCVLQPLYAGYPDYIMAPVEFLKHPLKWLQAISKYRATTSGGPNFAYQLCVRKITDEQKKDLDLSSWRVAFCGAEPVNSATLRAFSEAFASCGFRPQSFYPCYGLAEATLVVTAGPKQDSAPIRSFAAAALALNEVRLASPAEDSRALVGCGDVLAGQTVAIVDPHTLRPAPSHCVGEIWVSGPSVAKGYFNHPGATKESFGARTATGAGPYLRTGDLGFVHEGELFICGRIKDLIIVGGRNHYPQDIEGTVQERLPTLRTSAVAAFSIDDHGDEKVVVIVEIGPTEIDAGGLDPREIASAVRESVFAEHQLSIHDVALVRPGGIPRTSSGKLERANCRNLYLSDNLPQIER